MTAVTEIAGNLQPFMETEGLLKYYQDGGDPYPEPHKSSPNTGHFKIYKVEKKTSEWPSWIPRNIKPEQQPLTQ
jgi:hypothetical protein